MKNYCPTPQLRFRSLFLLLLAGLSLVSQTKAQVRPPELTNQLQFIETGNRYGNQVAFETALAGGKLFLQPTQFTFAFTEERTSHAHETTTEKQHAPLRAHAYSVRFAGAKPAALQPSDQKPGQYNYFIGNDESRWVSGAKAYGQVTYPNLYSGINLRLLEQNKHLKYEFVLEPGANPKQIRMVYEGAERLQLENGNLVIRTSVNTVTETSPYSYQLVNGKEVPVASAFRLKGNEISFELPDGYDESLPLIIDPEIVYSTFSGSTADNRGFSATYDAAGNIYTGGVVFGLGFPATTGAYDLTYASGGDIGILKFDPTQQGPASLVYATYLGGAGTEAPHSLYVNGSNELVIFGSTGSSDFPVTANAYDATFNGGPSITTLLQNGPSPTHPNGADLFISKLSAAGNALTASTFLGGSGTDGILPPGNPLIKNHGDQFRGEVITDAADNIYLASYTLSANFPVPNGFQVNPAGGTEAVICKLNPSLSGLLWSTYLGGSGHEAAFGIRLDSVNNVVVCGGTNSANFPSFTDAYLPTYNQDLDGYVAKISASGSVLQRATFLGTSEYDQAYLVDLDLSGNIYVFGQTKGVYPVTPGVFAIPASQHFIHKLNSSLTTSLLSTTFGSLEPQINLSPTAFMVNSCNTIYAAGWGGFTNSPYGGSSTFGLPVTPNAPQSTTDGADFYLIALKDDAASLLLGTYIGGAGVNDHVDGGISRFDKNSDDGILYQAACAGCGTSIFPTTPNAWSTSNGAAGSGTPPACNNAVFKFVNLELEGEFIPSEIANGPRDTAACAPATFHFRNEGTGVDFVWSFGDGTTTTGPGPVQHSYALPGIYPVSLTLIDSSTCAISLVLTDTLYIGEPTGEAGPDTVMCLPNQVQLEASGGVSYSWTASPTLSATNIPNPVASPTAPTTYTVTITNAAGCTKTETVSISQMPPVSISAMTSICPGDSTQLTATPGYPSYTWTPPTGLSATNIHNPWASPDVTTTYTVQVPETGGCPDKAYVTVTVFPDPNLVVPPADTICQGSAVLLPATASPGYTFQWSPAAGLSSTTSSSPVAGPGATTTYTVTVTSPPGCTQTDTVTVHVLPIVTISAQAPVCAGDSVPLMATPGLPFYSWTPAIGLSATNIFNPIATPDTTTTYTVYSVSAPGCPDSAVVTVQVLTLPNLSVLPVTPVCPGDTVQLSATFTPGLDVQWSPTASLSDSTIANPLAWPTGTTTYQVSVSGAGYCPQGAEVTVQVLPGLNANGPHLLCPGDSAQLEASPGLDSYTWWPASGLSATNIHNPVATPDSTTTYTVHATGGAPGCPDTAYVTVVITPLPQLSVSPAGPVCQGSAMQLSATAAPGYQFVWSPGTSLDTTGTGNPTALPDSTTTYTVTASNAAGCTATDTVTVQVIPLISATGPGPLCLGQGGQLSATAGLPSYSWWPATGLDDAGISNPVANPDSTTTYTVFVTGTGACPNSATITVAVGASAGLTIQPVAPICLGDSAQLSAVANPGFTFSWSPAVGLSDSSSANPLASPGITTTYTVSVTDSAGCSQSDTVTAQVIPLITATGQSTICKGQSAPLSATPGLSGYSWFPATGLSNPAIGNPIASPDSTITYTVTASGLGNCPNEAYFTLTVLPQPSLAVTGATSLCAGNAALLAANAGPGFSYSWLPAASLNHPDSASVLATPLETTLYTVTAWAGGCSSTDTVRVTVNPTPAAAAGPDAGYCTGGSAVLGSAGAQNVSFEWHPSTALSAPDVAMPVASPSETTVYTLTVTNSFGCTATDTVTVFVNDPPLVQMPGNTTVCQGASLPLSASHNPAYSYLWSPAGSLSSATAPAPIATPQQTTTYSLQTEIQGCSATQFVTVQVLPALVAQASPDALICPGANTQLTVTAYPGVAYSWWPAAGLAGTDSATALATPDATTTYHVQLTSVDGCTASASVTVNVVPAPAIAVTPAAPQGVEPLPVSFTNQSTGASSYSWNLGNNTFSSETHAAASYSSGTYTVLLTSTFGPGCTLTDTVAIVRVVPPMVPNIITPNGDGKNDTFEAILTNETLLLRMYNRWGKLVYESADYRNDWSAAGLADGVYYYDLSTPSGRSWKGWLEVVR